MAAERPLTPEKQLLNLIESPKAKNAVPLGLSGVKQHSLSLLSPGAWLGRFSFSRERFKKWLKDLKRHQLDVKALNKALSAGAAILALYFAGSSALGIINAKKMPVFKFAFSGRESAEVIQEGSFLKAGSYYLEKVRQRDIFQLGPKKAEESSEEPAQAGPSGEIQEATQHLRLVGISWSNDPDAMVEDTKALKTFFVKRGQMLGEVRVQAIFKDKVVLSYRGEETELR